MRLFESGVKAISENGAVGDPTSASPAQGDRYWEAAVALAEIERASA